jgi:hypothetical protein
MEDLFRAALLAQGYSKDIKQVTILPAPQVQAKMDYLDFNGAAKSGQIPVNGFLVGPSLWKFTGKPNGPVPNTWQNQLPSAPFNFGGGAVVPFAKPANGAWQFTWGPNPLVTYNAKSSPFVAQNNGNPLGMFTNHTITQIGGTYYDPSYGLTYSGPADFQRQALAGFYEIVKRNGQFFALLRETDNNRVEVKFV